jgi:hypothetical protein
MATVVGYSANYNDWQLIRGLMNEILENRKKTLLVK